MNFLNKKALLVFACSMALCLAVAGSALAGSVTITGAAYINDSAGASSATLANVPAGTADVTFTVPTSSSIQFSSFFGAGSCGITCNTGLNGGSTSYTVGSFLSTGNPAATNIVQNTSGALANTLNNTLFEFTATGVDITNGEQFLVEHDDGASFYVNGGSALAGISAGPTAPASSTVTYSGPTVTNATLVMVYGECCGAPAVFATNLPSGGGPTLTPEPSAFLLWGTGLGLLGLMLVSRRRKLFIS
ncbi:MAG: hypothetical protein ACRD11_04445 [Terriglobia bacterium]